MECGKKKKKVGCFQSAVCKMWCKCKQNEKVLKAKLSRTRKTSKHQNRKLKAKCLENRKRATKQMDANRSQCL